MPTSVVVATIVNTSMSEAGFRQHVGEQLRNNDRSLLDKLAAADDDADVFTAVLNVDEFLAYLIRRFPNTVDAAIMDTAIADAPVDTATVDMAVVDMAVMDTVAAPPMPPVETAIDTAQMSEGEFMDYMLMQLETGEIAPLVHFADSAWEDNGEHNEGFDEGDIGEDFSRHPFYY